MTSAIPAGSTVLVTGATGYLGSQTAAYFVAEGYTARIAVRNLDKGNKLKQLLESRHANGKVEVTTINDMADPNAYEQAIKGVSAVIHVASDVSFSTDAKKVIKSVVDATNGILRLAAAEPSVKRFVLTSSVVACASPGSGGPARFAPDAWNQYAIDNVYQADPNDPSNGAIVYAASKTFGEKAMWEFVEKEKPSFVANSVLPSYTIGGATSPDFGGSTWNFLNQLVKNEQPGTSLLLQAGFGNGWAVDVTDIARLHFGAATLESVKSQRLIGAGVEYDVNDWIKSFKKISPEKTADMPGPVERKEKPNNPGVDTASAVDVLKQLGRSGFESEEASLKATIAQF